MKDNLFDELNNAEVEQTSKASKKRDTVDSAQPKKSYSIPDVDHKQKLLLKTYRNQNKVSVRVAPSYAKYFGRTMRVTINGIAVTIRCDGKSVQVPEIFAAEIYRRMNHVDDYENRAAKMSEFQRNHESSPGSLNFFG